MITAYNFNAENIRTPNKGHRYMKTLFGKNEDRYSFFIDTDSIKAFCQYIPKKYDHKMDINIINGKEYFFTTMVNPVITKKGKKTPITNKEKIKEWFLTKSCLNIKNIEVGNIEVRIIEDKNVPINSVMISGWFEADEKTEKTLLEGIGNCRTYGYGFINIFHKINF